MKVDKEKMPTPDMITVECPMLPSENYRWVIFNFYAYCAMALITSHMLSVWGVKKFTVRDHGYNGIALASSSVYLMVVSFIHFRYRGMPNRLLGRHGRTSVDIITLCAAVMLHIFFPYDGSDSKKGALVFLTAATIMLHGWGKTLHLSWDICISDVLLQVLMEVGAYMSSGITCFFLLLLFCGVICYRFFSYSAPSTPEGIKKDLGPLAC